MAPADGVVENGVVENGVVETRTLDERAIRALYLQHHEELRGFARRLLGDPEAAEDLVHDVFVQLPRALSRRRGESSMRTFLRAVAINHVRGHMRRAIRRRRAMARLAAHVEYSAGLDREQLERRELARQLMAALDRLPVKQRLAFVLCEIEELPAAEAAAILEVPAATVRTRVFHAKQKLRELVGGEP